MEPRHVGGGMYQLSDGSRVRGKAKALAAEEALPKGLVHRVAALVVDLRDRGALTGAGESLAALALELADRLGEGGNAAMAHELREVLDDLEHRGHRADLSNAPEADSDDGGDDGADDFDRIVAGLSAPMGDAAQP